MIRMPIIRLVLCLLVVAAVLAGKEARAQPHELRVAVSSAQVVEFPNPARSVFIADPAIADIQVSAPTSVIVFGRKPGQTTLIAIGADDKPLAKIQIIVGYNYADLQRLIGQDVPNANVKITATPAGINLSGVVPDDETAEKVRAAAQRYVSDKDTVINHLQVAGPAQVNLRLRVAEVSRTVTKQLGFNWEAIMSQGSFAFGLATGRNAFLGGGTQINPVRGDIDGLISRTSPLSGAIAGANTNPTIQKIEENQAPKLSPLTDAEMLNPKLFARVAAIYKQRDAVAHDPESKWLIERTYARFIHAGANKGFLRGVFRGSRVAKDCLSATKDRGLISLDQLTVRRSVSGSHATHEIRV